MENRSEWYLLWSKAQKSAHPTQCQEKSGSSAQEMCQPRVEEMFLPQEQDMKRLVTVFPFCIVHIPGHLVFLTMEMSIAVFENCIQIKVSMRNHYIAF